MTVIYKHILDKLMINKRPKVSEKKLTNQTPTTPINNIDSSPDKEYARIFRVRSMHNWYYKNIVMRMVYNK